MRKGTHLPGARALSPYDPANDLDEPIDFFFRVVVMRRNPNRVLDAFVGHIEPRPSPEGGARVDVRFSQPRDNVLRIRALECCGCDRASNSPAIQYTTTGNPGEAVAQACNERRGPLPADTDILRERIPRG